MKERFSGSEVVEIGIEIEINGMDFYQKLATSTDNASVKDVFLFLAGEEDNHIVAFQKLLDSIQEYEPPEAYPGDYFVYMNALAGSHVFTQKNKGIEIAGKIKNDMEAIEIAIGFEKDSILFFEGMKESVPEQDKSVIDELVKQEKGHLSRLHELRRLLI
ncbi:MAG: ferritin family protein [bacterium]